MAKEILEVGDWIQYIAINGQTQHGKVDSLVEDMNEKETRVDLKLLNGQKDSIWINDEWVKAHPNASSLLDEKYNEINKQSNDLQQRKRNDTVNHPSHYNYGEIEVINFIEQVTKHYNPNVAYHIGNAIKYLARSPHKNGKEDVAKAKWYIERAFENWDK
ncbi:DUF3310 domain-containing protein [Staphylococcus xylosus]|uniref:DUF3310 domain-containing protein n=1 Tax=Staphylococcus xylosus TaxID=1288 RepID=UPI003F54BF63